MKIVEDYAQRKVDEKLDETKKEFVISLEKEGFKIDEIARIAKVDTNFVKKTLSK